MNNKLKIAVIVAIVALATFCTVLALTSWTHNYSWNVAANLNFEVYMDSELTQPYASGQSTVISDTSQPYVETFYIKNVGNMPLIVTASASISGATASWTGNPTGSIIVGLSTSLTLTVSNFQPGSGTLTVTFTSAAA